MKFGKYILVLVLCFSLFGVTKVYAEETESTDEVKYTMTINPNGGIPGPEFKDTIVLELKSLIKMVMFKVLLMEYYFGDMISVMEKH